MPTFDLGLVKGPKGDTGETGDIGPQGNPGATGDTGPAGADGVTPNVQVGTTTTLAAGSSATVTRRAGSPDSAPVFDFGIPKGADSVDPGDMKKSVYDTGNKAQDIFKYADTKLAKSGGTMTGTVTGVSPATGTSGLRNILFGTSAPSSGTGSNGDLYIYYNA